MQRVDRHDSGVAFAMPACALFASSPLPDPFASDSDSVSTSPRSDDSASPSASSSSSLASSPALLPSAAFGPNPDELFLSATPTPVQLAHYAASIVRNEAYALLALAARLAPVGPPVDDEEPIGMDPSMGAPQPSESKTNAAFRATMEGLAGLPAHGKVLVTGVGKSGIVGRKMVATFNSLGIQSVFLHPLEALHGDLGVVCPCSPTRPCDALIMISHSGATAELMRLLHIVRPRVRMLIAVTRDSESVLARACGHWLDAGTGAYSGLVKDGEKVTDEADTALPAPTSSVVTALAIGDAVALSLSKIRLGWEKGGKARRLEFLRCHPGGQLGIELGREGRGVAESSGAIAASS